MERQYKKEGANTQILTNENVMKNGGNVWRRSSDVNTNIHSGEDMILGTLCSYMYRMHF